MTDNLELIRRAQAGDRDADTMLVERNNGLIWSIVRRYLGRGVEQDDLYQLACLGFLKAVRGFNGEYGTQFSTYAVPKIAGKSGASCAMTVPSRSAVRSKNRQSGCASCKTGWKLNWDVKLPSRNWRSEPGFQ